MRRAKVTVVGAGQVGAMAAQRLVEQDLADVVLTDIVEGLPQGKALDMVEAAPIEGYECRVVGANDYGPMEGSRIVIVTAGIARKPGMSRSDLLATNADIVKGIAEQIRSRAPEAVVLLVTNPLDVMAYLTWKVTGFPRERVMGMSGVLDSARFRSFLAMELGVAFADVDAMVLGGHGDTMVPLLSTARVNGIGVDAMLSRERLEKIVDRTRNGGAEIVALLKTGSAWYAPSAAVVQMAKSILRDEGRLLAACVCLQGEYGFKDLFLGVPCILGREGLRKILALDLIESERAALRKSAEAVQADLAILQQKVGV
jgi:malate dehydrogenase